MAESIVPLTRLQALNQMLRAIQESPVSSEDNGLVESASAGAVLDAISVRVQSSGWWFNTEYNYSLALAEDGSINIPDNTLYVEPMDKTKDIVQRGTRLYDRYNQTYTFTAALLVKIVFGFAFEDLPAAARAAIAAYAAKKLQLDIVGDRQTDAASAPDVLLALNELERQNLRYNQFNINDGGPGFNMFGRRLERS